jgi:hypothetical protein
MRFHRLASRHLGPEVRLQTSLPDQARTEAPQDPADGFLARPPPIGPLSDARKTRGPELRQAPAPGVGPPRVARG